MELKASSYYDPNRFYNTYYLILMSLLKYFSKEIFKDDGTRMIYASSEFAFRARLNQLNANTNPDFSSLELPFGSLFRTTEWDKENKAGVIHAGAALGSITLPSGRVVRFMNMTAQFELTLYFHREDDAQIALEILRWIQYPSKKLIQLSGMEYKGEAVDVPLCISLTDIDYAGQYKEKQWIEEQRMIPIKATILADSVIFDQYAQGASSGLFTLWPGSSGGDEIVLTEKVVLDFLSYHGSNKYFDKTGLLLEVASTVAPDPDLLGSLIFNEYQLDENGDPVLDSETGLPLSAVQDNSLTINWDYNEGTIENPINILPLYETNVRITCSNGTTYEVPMANKTFTIEGLEIDSYYEVAIFFIAKNGSVTKYVATGHTTLSAAPPNLKGMIGLTW